jgi:hypothetical protein
LYLFIGIPAFLQSEFSLTPAGTKNPGQVTALSRVGGLLSSTWLMMLSLRLYMMCRQHKAHVSSGLQ